MKFRPYFPKARIGLRGYAPITTPTGLTRRAPSASALDLAFSKSEQVVSKELLKKKMRPSNAFVGKIPDGEQFPLHVGTQLKQRRLTRIGVPNTGWRPVSDDLCATNTHLDDPDVIHHGSEDFLYSLVEKDMRTDDINLAALAHRAIPDEEVGFIEEGLQTVALYVHEQFRRSRYHDFCGNKYIALAPASGGTVIDGPSSIAEGDAINNGWMFETRANGEMDEDHVRVCCTVAQIPRISELTLDMLDLATTALAYEGDPYMGDTMLFDTLLAEQRMYIRLAAEENAQMDQAASRSESYDMIDLARKYGTSRLIRNYAIRYDSHSPRFYPDVAFNTAMTGAGGYAFSDTDPTTWPRFVRVYPYYEVKTTRGTKWEKNMQFIRAPFGLSTLFNPRVMDVMSFPDVQGVGSAQVAKEFGGFGYDGVAKWMNFIDRTHNPKGVIGHWALHFKMAARPKYTEEGYSYFHRISSKMVVVGNSASIPTLVGVQDVSQFCATQLGGTSSPNGAAGAVSMFT